MAGTASIVSLMIPSDVTPTSDSQEQPPPVITLREITKVYRMGDLEVPALRGVDLDILRGEFVAIMGPSGSGKSTLMNIIGCLDQPSVGSYVLNGTEVAELNDDGLAVIRNRAIGFEVAHPVHFRDLPKGNDRRW